MLAGLLGGNRIGPWAGAGILLALVAVVLVSAEGGLGQLREARPASLTAPLLAGTAFGFFFVLLDRISADAGLTPLVAARLASLALVVAVARRREAAAAGGSRGPPARPHVRRR